MDLSKFPKEIQNLGWVNFHILVIDLFLWWIAKRGYTLQRSRQKVEFLDLQDDIESYEEEQREYFRKHWLKNKETSSGGFFSATI